MSNTYRRPFIAKITFHTFQIMRQLKRFKSVSAEMKSRETVVNFCSIYWILEPCKYFHVTTGEDRVIHTRSWQTSVLRRCIFIRKQGKNKKTQQFFSYTQWKAFVFFKSSGTTENYGTMTGENNLPIPKIHSLDKGCSVFSPKGCNAPRGHQGTINYK